MASLPASLVTAEEYLAWERQAETRHEYFDGEIVAMAGASFAHILTVRNILRVFGETLKGTGCSEFAVDLRLSVSPGLICYPDIIVACAPFEFLPGNTDTLTNPKFVVEVLSRSTRGTDRNFKLPRYRNIPSLTGYLFVEQDRVAVEFGRRVSEGEWQVDTFTSLADRLDLAPLPCALEVARIYADVQMT